MPSNSWSTAAQLRARLMLRWESGHISAEALIPTGMFPQRIALKHPSSSALSAQFAQAQKWVYELLEMPLGCGIELEWRDINHRQLGRNRLPVALLIHSAEAAAAWLGKKRKLQIFLALANQLLNRFPKLQPWVLKKPHLLIENIGNLQGLMAVVEWLEQNPKPNKYLRQLNLPGIDTKFIERHKKLLSEWLDLMLPAEAINSHSNFAVRYGFLDKPELIRVRILDPSLYLHNLSDLTITT